MAKTAEVRPITLGFYNTPEQRHPVPLKVSGTIPAWLEGSLYRGASGVYDVGSFTTEHWFDGFSRLYRFEISNGEVTYRSRNISDEVVNFIRQTGRYPGAAFCQDPCKIMLGALESTWRDGRPLGDFPSGHNVGVDFIKDWPGLRQESAANSAFKSLVATTDSNELLQVDLETLEPLNFFTYQKYDTALHSAGLSSAHPTVGLDGSVYNHVLLPTDDGGAEYQVFELNPAGESRVLATITDAPASYLHEVFGTESFVILVVWQAYLDFEKLDREGSILGAVKPWDPNSDSLFYVVDKRQGGVIAKYRTDPFFTFHAIAAYEDEADGSIVIDLPWMKNYDYLNGARVPNLRAKVGQPDGDFRHDLAGSFRRYRLPDVRQGHEGSAVIDFELPYDSCNIELPKLNQAYRLKPYRYAYGVHVVQPGFMSDSLVKIDVQQRNSKVYRPDVDAICSEPIFVASPKTSTEDDGVLLSVVMDTVQRKSFLVVLDAGTMREIDCHISWVTDFTVPSLRCEANHGIDAEPTP